MADKNPFDDFIGFDDRNEFEELEARPAACAVCETMLPEAADGMLSEAEQSAFDKHVAGCMECARELADAQRGAAWLSMLKTQTPAPPDTLLARILAETTGVAQPAAAQVPAVAEIAAQPFAPQALAIQPPQMHPWQAPRGWSSQWSSLREQLRGLPKQLRDVVSIESARTTFQPRIAMTAAMAFFSIALTLNLTGVRLRDLRPSNFTPSALKRSVANVDASATRMFQNNRAVYQVESRLSELRSDDAPGDPASGSAR